VVGGGGGVAGGGGDEEPDYGAGGECGVFGRGG